MLKVLRKKGVMKKLLWVVAVVIIVSFGVFGRASRLSRGNIPTYAGKIFGRRVSFSEFRKSLFRSRIQAILTYGDNFYKMKDRLDLNAEAWDRLILLHEAKKRNIKVSDKEVIQTIGQMDLFKRNGRFDQDLYEKILGFVFQVRDREFEENIRESLIFEKLFRAVTNDIQASDEEVLQEYKNLNEKVKVSYVLFSPDDFFKQVNLNPDEVKKFFEEHKEEFRMPPTINVQYITLPLLEDASADQKSEAAVKAQQISQALGQGANFEATAKKFGGIVNESGPFSYDQPNLKIGWSYELLQRAFDLTENEISEPIETPQGFYILRLKEKRDAYIPTFEEAHSKVKEVLTRERAHLLAREKAQETQQVLSKELTTDSNKTFAGALKNLGLEAQQTPLFVRGQYIPNIGPTQTFQNTAFTLSKQKPLSKVVEVPKGYAILYFEEFVPIDQQKFEDGKQAFAKQLLAAHKRDAFNQFILQLRLKADLEDNISKTNKPSGQNQGT